jgi:hypothetical protein
MTEALILSNYEIEKEEIPYMSSDMLGTYIINNLDIEISPYFIWLNNTRKALPASNKTILIRDNVVISMQNMNNIEQDIFEKRKKGQYYMF